MDDYIDEELAAFAFPATLADRRMNAIERAASRLHATLIHEWAALDDGPLPTFADAIAIATVEIDAVCEALGDLSDYSPSQVFHRDPFRRGRREPL